MDKIRQRRIHVSDIDITLYYRHGHSLRPLGKLVKDSVTTALKFFSNAGVDIQKQKIRIKLLYSRSEFDKALGKSTENWLSGSIKKGTILIFHPDVLERESSHKKTELSQILTHEICHIFIDRINPKSSWWLDEGVAQYAAGQKPTRKTPPINIDYFIKNHLFKNTNYDAFISHNGYQIAYMMTEMLIKKHGKDVVIELLKIKPGKDMKKKFLTAINESPKTFLEAVREIGNY